MKAWYNLNKEEKKKRTKMMFPLIIVCYIILFSILNWYKAAVLCLLITISYQIQYNKYVD